MKTKTRQRKTEAKAMSERAMLEIRHFTKSYGGKTKAADDVNLSVYGGDICGFIGHNGAGKSTTIRAVVGVLDFSRGEIFIDGHSVKDDPIACKQVTAYIPDNPDLYENLTGIQYLKQKVAIISALIHEPKLLVLDEPFVGLDPKASFTLKEIMREMCREGTAIFFSTHVLDVAEKLCNKVAIIRKGRIIASGTMEELTEGHSLEEAFLEADNEK